MTRLPLPTELILLILDQLTWTKRMSTLHACSLVNKQFHTIVNPLLWNHPVTLYDKDVRRLLACLNRTTPRHPQSPGQHIHHRRWLPTFCTNDHFTHLFPYVPNLQSLYLSGTTRITHTAIQRLLRLYQHLTSLQISGVTLTPSTFITMGCHCRQLRHLGLYHCDLRQSNILQPLADQCHLEDLTIHKCAMDEHTTVADITWFQDLTSLRLMGHARPTMTSLLLTAATPITTTTYPLARLKIVSFMNFRDVDDATWLLFIKTHTRLQEISISAYSLTNASMIPMTTWLPGLTHVEIVRRFRYYH